jgi:hypothetical protein
VREVSAKGPPGNERLSDARLLSRWANPVNRSAIRRAARSDSRRVGRLHPLTEDGYPEVYLALRSHRTTDGQLWIKIRIPARPNGQTGWVRRGALGPLHAVTTALVIDRRRAGSISARSFATQTGARSTGHGRSARAPIPTCRIGRAAASSESTGPTSPS